MKTLNIVWKGISPLIMHSCKGVNPLHPLSKGIKPLTSKTRKTDEDYARISDFQWLLGAYYTNDNISDPDEVLSEDHKLYIPAENIEATIINGGKPNKKGTDIKKFAMMVEPFVYLKVLGNPSFETMKKDFKYRDVRQMVINKSRITRTRPRFDSWELEFTYQYNEEKIDLDAIVTALEHAGQYVGLCDSRPKYGKFAVIVTEVD